MRDLKALAAELGNASDGTCSSCWSNSGSIAIGGWAPLWGAWKRLDGSLCRWMLAPWRVSHCVPCQDVWYRSSYSSNDSFTGPNEVLKARTSIWYGACDWTWSFVLHTQWAPPECPDDDVVAVHLEFIRSYRKGNIVHSLKPPQSLH